MKKPSVETDEEGKKDQTSYSPLLRKCMQSKVGLNLKLFHSLCLQKVKEKDIFQENSGHFLERTETFKNRTIDSLL